MRLERKLMKEEPVLCDMRNTFLNSPQNAGSLTGFVCEWGYEKMPSVMQRVNKNGTGEMAQTVKALPHRLGGPYWRRQRVHMAHICTLHTHSNNCVEMKTNGF